MKYLIEPEVLSGFPGYVRGVVVACGCDNTHHDLRLRDLMNALVASVAGDASLEPLAASPRVAAWRCAFSRFGATPSKYPSSLESVLKRARRGEPLPYINDLVSLGTYLTLRHRLPTGGHDLDRVSGDLVLKVADGTEMFIPLGGGPEERPEPGEVVFSDSVQVLCRRWVWRQAEVDKVRESTTRLVMNFDGLPPATVEQVGEAMTECEELLRTVFGAHARRVLLTRAAPVAELGEDRP